MFRSLSCAMFIVYMFTFLSIHNVSYAGVRDDAWEDAKVAVENAWSIMEIETRYYNRVNDDLQVLITDWNANEAAIKKGRVITYYCIVVRLLP